MVTPIAAKTTWMTGMTGMTSLIQSMPLVSPTLGAFAMTCRSSRDDPDGGGRQDRDVLFAAYDQPA